MPISLLLLYGAMGGLASVLLANLVRPWIPSAAGDAVAEMPRGITLRELAEAGLHLFAGAAVAALYWLSWGFAALVSVPWWLRGIVFGIACWLAIALPVIGTGALRMRLRPGQTGLLLFEWGCTCVFAAVACAWIWATMP